MFFCCGICHENLIFFADGDSDVMDSLVDRGQELVSQRLVVVVVVGLLQKSSELPHSTIPFSPIGNIRVHKGSCSYWLKRFLAQSLACYCIIIFLYYKCKCVS